MGSQTLEILRQGIWASLTGGWFYDPHQNLFCNTVHLYIWLFLLCSPFSIYLYFPPASFGWLVYCGLVCILFVGLKMLNHSLHHMYDTSECIVEQPPSDFAASSNNNAVGEEGVEMQMLRVGGAPNASSDYDSITSLEYQKANNSTIDLKVDVHRKNSSESSVEDSIMSVDPASEAVAVTKSDLCIVTGDNAMSITRTTQPKSTRRREHRPKTRRVNIDGAEELKERNLSVFPAHMLHDDGPFSKVSRRYRETPHRRGSSNRDFFKEWLYLDGRETMGEPYQSKFARQLSSDLRDHSEPYVGLASPKRAAHRCKYCPDESCTKSAMALATGQCSNIRKNSNSTMSTIQLPLLNSTAQLVSHMRRHSNNADTAFFASVELGQYMMAKNEVMNKSEKSKERNPGVRRIKSAALEVGCPPPSVSNLSPHPNSAETIGGQTLKNPKSAVIPPPSKSLTRGPHLNLCPKNEQGEESGYPYFTYGSEIVYPIAEISDEMQTSQKETDIDSSADSYSDYEDDKQFRGFDWEADQSPAVNSSDSDYENRSRSPLLTKYNEARLVPKTADSKNNCCEHHLSHKKVCEHKSDKSKPARSTRSIKKQHDSRRPNRHKKSDCKHIGNKETNGEKSSVNSKNMLIEKSSLDSTKSENKDDKSENKHWDHIYISNSSSTSDACLDDKNTKLVLNQEQKIEITEGKSSDDGSVISLDWLFNTSDDKTDATDPIEESKESVERKLSNISAEESTSSIPKNLGAIPKQLKSIAHCRTSSQKENKKKESKKENDEIQNDDPSYLDAVEAQAALVQGLECLFAATNANTVVMPQPNRDERSRSRRQSVRSDRDNANKARKRSIEEVAQTSTNTLLPTSMPLLAAFLNSRSDHPSCCGQSGAHSETQNPEEAPRSRPLIDRNHRNRVRKIKRSTRQRNNQHKEKQNPGTSGNGAHLATSFDDTSDGAIHYFMDEYGNWMSYTFDKNNANGDQVQSVPNKDKCNRKKSADTSQETGEGSCGSVESEASNTESVSRGKRKESINDSSVKEEALPSGSNSTVVPINTNARRLYVFNSSSAAQFVAGERQPRSPVAYATDSLLEQIEAERQSRMGLPSMHINFLMNQQRQEANNLADTMLSNIMPSIGEENYEIIVKSKVSELVEEIEKANKPKPKSYYKYKLSKCFEVKISMDRLRLLALFDRNLSCKETVVSVALAILVSILGSLVLNLGFYRDIYAFWFCFIMAGSQYSLLKSVQPDAASPVHGFNKMVLFSRPIYFCICTALLCLVHNHLEQSTPIGDIHVRNKRSDDAQKPFTIYGILIDETEILSIMQNVISKMLMFFPFLFSLGLFPQFNTFLMYLLEQIDMHVFGGNATCSLSAATYCIARSMAAISILYGFAYSGIIEGKKSQSKHNILFSIFCGLLVPIAYHLSRSASDYTHLWNLVKKHLIPPDLYLNSPECSQNREDAPGTEKAENNNAEDKKDTESNLSKQNSIGSSASKINFSSETNIAKKKSHASSASSLKMDPRDTLNSNNSLKKIKDTNNYDAADITEEEMEDPLPKKLQETVNGRLKNDVIVCTVLGLFTFGLHSTTIFMTLSPQLITVLWCVCGVLGWVTHYVWPQLRKQQPWLCISSPILKPKEHAQFEVTEPAKLMWFEKVYVYACFVERNLLYPALVVAACTRDAPALAEKYGDGMAALLLCVCALKCLRNSYSAPECQYLIVVFAILLFQKDLSTKNASETFLVDYFVMGIIYIKVYEFLLKLQFIVTYTAPWQVTWGSAFHAFAQPLAVPHAALLLAQTALAALLSAPVAPALGSAIFIMSYVRPVKFWERDYNTRRVDQSNTRLSSQLERNLGADDNNLNSIFYEHLTRSLQHYLCGDLMLGRWGKVAQGDCFVLASDYLNCLVHIVEMGNGLVSFQLRGLEFRGTYCQQREVEAISEGPEGNGESAWRRWWCGRALAPRSAWSLRWLAWQLAAARYVLSGYSVADNSALSMLQVFDFRKILITYYVKSIIYYTIQSSKLDEWLASPVLQEALKPMAERTFVDLDPIFNSNLDEDYDFRASGITRSRFCAVYGDWVGVCAARRGVAGGGARRHLRDSPLLTLCFALSLVGRRALAAAHHHSASSVEVFLYGLHALFKGDFRIACARDEWVLAEVALLRNVLAPAVRMALKLHQDHFMFPEEYGSGAALHAAIASHSRRLVICHEAAPAWRYSVLRGAPHLLALRHVVEEGGDDYKIIMLTKRQLSFRVVRLNRECVRALWAGQQHELVYLRNRNPERGSIQNAKQALRNIINSSCDQPIGYPIYVSPLTTSYADTSPPLLTLLGAPLTVRAVRNAIVGLWRRVARRCGEGWSSGARDLPAAEAGAALNRHAPPNPPGVRCGSAVSVGGGKPGASLASLAGLLREQALAQEEAAYHEWCETARAQNMRMRASNAARDAPRSGGGRSRARRERARGLAARAAHAHRDPNAMIGGSWEGQSWRDQSRHSVNSKAGSGRAASEETSGEEEGAGGADLSLPDCKIIANRSVRHDSHFKRYIFNESAPKDLSKPNKEIRHERESYRELTGRYTEKPESGPSKEPEPAKENKKEKRDPKPKDKSKMKRSDSKVNISVGSKVVITEPLGVYDCINLGRRIDVQWPSEHQRERGGRNFWGSWVPEVNMDGVVIHKWMPNHPEPKLRSHVNRTILLVQIEDKFVPIAESCVQDLGDEV